MKKILAITSIALSLVVLSCNDEKNDPSAVLKHFFEAMSNNDLYRAKTMVTRESRGTIDMIEIAMRTSPGEIKIFETAGKDFGDAEIRNDLARVPVTDAKTGSELDFMLKKENGQWKVWFERDAFVEMGIGGLKDWIDKADNGERVLDEIQHIDIDSLKNSFKKRLPVPLDPTVNPEP